MVQPIHYSISFLMKFCQILLSISLLTASVKALVEEIDGVDASQIDGVGGYTVENVVTTDEDYRYTCSILVNKTETCRNYGPYCEIKFEWTFPEHLTELIKRRKIAQSGGLSIRDLPVEFRGPDLILYQSRLHIPGIGYAYRGQWYCNLKFINKDTGKIDILSKSLQIKVKENGARGIFCRYDNQCSSFNCVRNVCMCDDAEPIEWSPGECRPAPSIGERCRIDDDCQSLVEGAKCLCPEGLKRDECYKNRTCQCSNGEVAVNLGLKRFQCMKKVKMHDTCQRSAQCEAIDPDTYCSYDHHCRCKGGKKCRDPLSIICSEHIDCGTGKYCSSSGRCQVLKTLGSTCENDVQCEEKAMCSKKLRVCSCKSGYKVSSIKMACIPDYLCISNTDCPKGYCDSGRCKNGIPLNSKCKESRQCRALDSNSMCDRKSEFNGGVGDGDKICVCAPYYQESELKSMCILDGKCLGDADCKSEDDGGGCIYGQCVYPRKLSQKCETTNQCLQSVNYSMCLGQCKCLNETDQLEGECNSERKCEHRSDCLVNQFCDTSDRRCSCLNDYESHLDGFCYKKQLTPPQDKGPWYDLCENFRYEFLAVGIFICMAMIILIFVHFVSRKNDESPTKVPLFKL
ncbi:uncharacterized protein LOC141852447 isoform X2 [Brevipalpus obovatus]|uniref:uncharacterized protein LOC141852447 isoform X2 n=1 Tax=Brevipalpus obovatus TaxID=246614 RepID=UPI003D9EFAC0